MARIDSITLQAADSAAAERFYRDAFGLDGQVRIGSGDDPSEGFRGFTMSLIVSQPANADALLDAATAAGATALKPASKSMWGYGGVVRSPDGAIWKVATSAKKDTGPATREIDEMMLLLGVADVPATRRFYEERGIPVGKSFARSYVQFDTPGSPIKLGLYKRRALAKDAGVPADGSGSHRLVIDGDIGALDDPDGFVWDASGA